VHPSCLDWIRSGIERDDRYTPEEVIAGIERGEFQLFRYPKGIVVTQITGHQRLLVFLLSGTDLDEWKEQATKDLKAFAQMIGIEVIEAYCRPGLEKMLKDVGWEKTQVVLKLR
jgi:hypothetical protein